MARRIFTFIVLALGDASLGNRFAVVEIPQPRVVAAYAKLQDVSVCEDVVLDTGSTPLSCRSEKRGLEYHLEYLNGQNSAEAKTPHVRLKPWISLISGTKKDVRGRL